MDTGMVPVRLLFRKSSTRRLASLSPSSDGTRPWSLLRRMAMTVSPVQELRLAGSSPDKALSLRLSVWRRRRLPMLAGMPPLRPLELRSRVLRKDRLPMAGERTPVSPREGRLSATIRWITGELSVDTTVALLKKRWLY
uniref:Uncharacterized protein n=1 Tax=Setaria viridis TaxID=4556 RepID=A0A4U6UCD7_SETVI|nr:hypothetical protein SEVIR_5G103950v2 [Setaria viridis]